MNDKSLNSRERVKNLLSHDFVDRIPKGELIITDDIICNGGVKGIGFEKKHEFIQNLGLDLVTLSPSFACGGNQLPSPAEVKWPEVKSWVAHTSLFTFAILDGAFEWGLRIFGLEDFLIELVRNPNSFLEFIHQVEFLNLAIVSELISEGIDGIILADDIAHQNGLFTQPDTLRNLFIPSLANQVEFALSRNIPIFFHSDGNYLPVMADIINAGFTGLQCLEKRAGMNIDDIRQQYGQRIILWGHLDMDDVAKISDPSTFAELVQDIRRLTTQGDFILGTTSGIFAGIELNLLKVLYNAV